MSLIDEALKRARQEAARQDAAQRYAYPSMPAQVPLRDRSRSSLVVGLVAGLLLGVLAIGGTLWWTGRHRGLQVASAPEVPTSAPAPAQAAPVETTSDQTAPGPAAPAPATPVQAAPRTPLPAAPAPEPQRPVAPQPQAAPRATVPAPAPVEPRPLPPPPPAAEPAAPAPQTAEPAPAPDAAPAAAEEGLDGRTFVRELPVPGGGRLELRGIASGSKPAALLNGRVVAPGEVVEGFTVVGVDAQKVELRGYGATVYLSLK